MNYLIKTKYGVYKVRMRVPECLRPHLPMAYIERSLFTKDKSLALGISKKISAPIHHITFLYKNALINHEVCSQMLEQFFKDSFHQSLESLPSSPITEHKGMTNEQVISLYLRNYKPTTSEIQYQEKYNFFNGLIKHLLKPKGLINAVTLEDILKIREILAKLPKRNIQKYRVMPPKQLISTYIPEEDIISTTTLNKQIKWIRSLFEFCILQGYITRNPVASLGSIAKDEEALLERLPLDNKEVLTLFKVTEHDYVIHNVIKLLAYTGLRVSEMYKASIKEHCGVSCFDLTDRTLKLKTKASYRLVPIADNLNIDCLNSLPNISTLGHKVNGYIRQYVSKNPKKVMYSLRHSFATKLKHARVDPLVISELMGHSHEGMTMGRYASRYPVEILKEAIDKLEY